MFSSRQTANLTLVFKDSSPSTPLIFVLSQGTDPAADLYKFAEEMRFAKKLSAISLGQGQVCMSYYPYRWVRARYVCHITHIAGSGPGMYVILPISLGQGQVCMSYYPYRWVRARYVCHITHTVAPSKDHLSNKTTCLIRQISQMVIFHHNESVL